MSEMPRLDLAAVAAAVLDDRNRIRRGARRMLAGEPVYCARRHHLQCFVVRTLDGLAVFWRPAEEARMARDVWAEGWADQDASHDPRHVQLPRQPRDPLGRCDRLTATRGPPEGIAPKSRILTGSRDVR